MYEPPVLVSIMGINGAWGSPDDGIHCGVSFRDDMNVLKHTCIWPDGSVRDVTDDRVKFESPAGVRVPVYTTISNLIRR